MSNPGLTYDQMVEAVEAFDIHGEKAAAAASLNMPVATFKNRLDRAREAGVSYQRKPFEVETPPDEMPSAEELIERRKRQFGRKQDAEEARRLIPIRVRLGGPIGICHFGDPHVDDDGTDLSLLERHIKAVNDCEGMFAANLGDMQNNWVGRLAHLYSEQSTSAAESWVLTEWLVKALPWLYIVGGNHDLWSGAGDPIKWIAKQAGTIYEAWGVRAQLKFPNGKNVIINARHDFTGHSMWNAVHGPMKAIQMGWRDHILTCGHKHTSFMAGPLKCPSSGLLSYAIRCAGYKTYDRYAKEKGLPDQNAFASAVTIIDPRHEDNDPRLVHVMCDPEQAAEYLTWLRKDL